MVRHTALAFSHFYKTTKKTVAMGNFSNELLSFNPVPRNLVFDDKLSDRARFVYVFMACKPDGWDFYLEPMAKELGYSVDTLRKYINELVESGWLVKGEQKNEKGVFGATEYTLKANNVDRHINLPTRKNTDTENFRHGKNPSQDNIYILDNRDNRDNKDNIKKENSKKEKEDEDKFVEEIYNLYPTKCPIRNVYTGKCAKDKEKIRRLLKTYSREDIEKVVKAEVDEKYGKSYLRNFSTFLNNFPDPKSMFGHGSTLTYPQDMDSVKEEDVQPNLSYFQHWMANKMTKVHEEMKGSNDNNGFPQDEKTYQYLCRHTVGGTRGLCYVVLVFNRDGWEEYYDNRGFMFTYSNYIKRNGMYKE